MGPWIEHLMDDEGLSLSDARAVLAGWEAIPYIDQKHGHMATLMKRNREVHFAVFKKYRLRHHINVTRIKKFLQPILDSNVFLVTKLDNPKDEPFIKRLGFEELSVANDGITCYILNNIRYPGTHHVSSI